MCSARRSVSCGRDPDGTGFFSVPRSFSPFAVLGGGVFVIPFSFSGFVEAGGAALSAGLSRTSGRGANASPPTTSTPATERGRAAIAWRALLSRLNSTGCFPTKIRLFMSTVMTRRSSSDRNALAFACGRLTSTPWVSIGAVTMKMMRSTSITSTRGTMLMSDIILRSLPFPLVKAIGLHLLQVPLEEVHELDGETVEPGGDRPHPVQKEVVRHDRRDRGGQPGRGRDQRLGDPGGDRGEGGAAGAGDFRGGGHAS